MSEWYDSQKNSSSNFRKLLQKQIEKANPRRQLTSEEEKRLAKLEAIAEKLKAISRFVWVAWNRVMRARHQMLWCRVRLAGG